MNKNNQRWLQVIIGVIVFLFAGMVYAWSVMGSIINKEFNWTASTLSMTFTLTMIFFCVGCMAGGFLNKKVSCRLFVWVSAVLFLAGFLLSSVIHTPFGLYMGFGVLCGTASGLVYNAVLSTVNPWFPDKQGLVSGILMMGFGISAFIVGKLFQAWTPAAVEGWRTSFQVMGVLTAVVFVISSLLLKKPGTDFNPPAASAKKKQYVNPVAMEATTPQMMKEPAFWAYYVWAIVLSAAGLALVSQASGFAFQINAANEAAGGAVTSASTIATLVGLISIFNGIGRVVFGGMFDKVGRSVTMQMTNVLFIVSGIILLTALSTNSMVILTIGFILGGFSYGGINPANSAFISSYYGRKHYPTNFSIINTNLVIASFGSTIAAALKDATQSYSSAIIMLITLAAVGILASLAISFFDKKKLSK